MGCGFSHPGWQPSARHQALTALAKQEAGWTTSDANKSLDARTELFVGPPLPLTIAALQQQYPWMDDLPSLHQPAQPALDAHGDARKELLEGSSVRGGDTNKRDIDAMIHNSTHKSRHPFPTIQGNALVFKGNARMTNESIYNGAVPPFDLPADITPNAYSHILYTINQSAAQALKRGSRREDVIAVRRRAQHALKAVEQTLQQLNAEYDGRYKLTQHVEAIDSSDRLSQKVTLYIQMVPQNGTPPPYHPLDDSLPPPYTATDSLPPAYSPNIAVTE